jgi:hypothetical protein
MPGNAAAEEAAVKSELSSSPGRACMEQQEVLRRRFAESGVQIEDAVFAFSGMYPTFGGYGNYELLFTRQRLIAKTSQGLGVWVAYTGPTPTKPLGTYSISQFSIVDHGGRYPRVLLGNKKFWVPEGYKQVLNRWSALAQGTGGAGAPPPPGRR